MPALHYTIAISGFDNDKALRIPCDLTQYGVAIVPRGTSIFVAPWCPAVVGGDKPQRYVVARGGRNRTPHGLRLPTRQEAMKIIDCATFEVTPARQGGVIRGECATYTACGLYYEDNSILHLNEVRPGAAEGIIRQTHQTEATVLIFPESFASLAYVIA